MLYHIKQGIVPISFCDEVIKQGEEKDLKNNLEPVQKLLQIQAHLPLNNYLKDSDFTKKIRDVFDKRRTERVKFLGKDQSAEIEKKIFLQSLDINWKSHIQYLEQLRQVIGLRSYGQRDPLVEYKKEAFGLFEDLLNKLKIDYIRILMNLAIVEKPKNNPNVLNPKKIDPNQIRKKIGRNEPCFCGSKKIYKHCCGSLR